MVTTACTMLLYSPARSPYVVMSVGKMLSFAPVSATKSPIRVRIFRLSAARISGRNLHFFCIFRPLMSAFFLLCVVSNSGISNHSSTFFRWVMNRPRSPRTERATGAAYQAVPSSIAFLSSSDILPRFTRRQWSDAWMPSMFHLVAIVCGVFIAAFVSFLPDDTMPPKCWTWGFPCWISPLGLSFVRAFYARFCPFLQKSCKFII